MNEAWTRQEMLLGQTERLYHAHVAVFGIGGVGSYCVEALARAGVGRLTLVDHDTVGVTNLNRQLCALSSTIGKPKAEVMADRVLDINPQCQVRSLVSMYTPDTAEDFFADYDYIVDAIDTVSCKLSLIMQAKAREIPIVSAMGTGNKLDPTKFQITDISKTTDCPLARVVRKELRARGIFHHTVLFSKEEPLTPNVPQGQTPPPGRRSIPGSVSWVPSCAGLMLAGYVVQQLIKIDV